MIKRITLTGLALCLAVVPAWGKDDAKPQAATDKAAALPAPAAEAKTNVLDLQAAQRLALKGNPGIGAAQARIEQAKAKIAQAIASQQPSLDAAANVGAQSNKDGDISENSSAGLQGSWLMFDGHARKFQQEQAEQGEKVSAEAKRNSQRLLVAAVADAFYNAQLARTSIDIATADQEFYEQQLKDAQHRFDAGAGSWGDVLNIRVQVNSAKNSLINAKRQYEAARYGLAALLAAEAAALPELAALEQNFVPSEEESAADTEAMIREALKNRPDIKRLAWQIKAAEAGINAAEAQSAPKVRLSGQAGLISQEELLPEDFGASLALGLTWNLYSGGAVEAAAMEARQGKREAAYSRADLSNSIAAEIRQDAALLTAAAKQVRLQQESVELVKENRKLAKNEYEAGAASLTRLNEAQRDLTATYGRLAQAVSGYHQARHQLLSAAGKNLEPFVDLLDVKMQEPKAEAVK
ncbi:MAG: TolC family protein [Candidatus Electronema sp. VV]